MFGWLKSLVLIIELFSFLSIVFIFSIYGFNNFQILNFNYKFGPLRSMWSFKMDQKYDFPTFRSFVICLSFKTPFDGCPRSRTSGLPRPPVQ